MNYREEYARWLASDALTAEERAELEAIRGDDREIRERFYAPLSFGTAGLRPGRRSRCGGGRGLP